MGLVSWSAREAERRLAPLGERWAHTLGVVARARALERVVPVADREVLVAAAYLHDVGYDPELASTGFHPLDGALWLRAEGRERLACLVANHSGARFAATLIGLGDALDEFPPESSATADALTYCDLTTDRDGREVTPAGRLAEIERRYGAESDAARAIAAGGPELAELVARVEQRMAGNAGWPRRSPPRDVPSGQGRFEGPKTSSRSPGRR
jgi:hypothetical protein